MKKGVVHRSGIDTDARWGYSHTKGWIFGYKLHLTSTTAAAGHLIVPLTADVTTANVYSYLQFDHQNRLIDYLATAIIIK